MRQSTLTFTIFGLALALTLSLFSSKGFATDSREVSEEEINQCVQECVSWFQTPGAELKACVSLCLNQRREPAKPVWSNPEAGYCETYETDCDRIP